MPRRFSQEESAAILRRAIELHSSPKPEAGSSGQSLAELQKTASELGIDPALVARAASELGVARTRPSRIGRMIGGPHHIEFERRLDGRITEDSWPRVIDVIRRATGRIGNPSQVGSMFEWTSTEPDSIHVSFVPDSEGTRVRVVTEIGSWGFLLFFLPTIFALMFSAIFGAVNHFEPALRIAFIFGILAATLLGARHLFSGISARRQKMMDALSDSLVDAFVADREGLRENLTTPAPAVDESGALHEQNM